MNWNTYQPQPQVTAQQKVLANDLANAQASADPRFTMKQYDRPGLSRAGGAKAQAGIDAGQNLVNGVAQAYGNYQNNQTNAANTALQYASGQEQFGQALNGLAQQNAYQQAMNRMGNLQAGVGILGTLMR
jgi:hypothetical protein